MMMFGVALLIGRCLVSSSLVIGRLIARMKVFRALFMTEREETRSRETAPHMLTQHRGPRIDIQIIGYVQYSAPCARG